MDVMDQSEWSNSGNTPLNDPLTGTPFSSVTSKLESKPLPPGEYKVAHSQAVALVGRQMTCVGSPPMGNSVVCTNAALATAKSLEEWVSLPCVGRKRKASSNPLVRG